MTHWGKNAEKFHWDKSRHERHSFTNQNKTRKFQFSRFSRFLKFWRCFEVYKLKTKDCRSKNSQDFVQNCNLKQCGRRSQHIFHTRQSGIFLILHAGIFQYWNKFLTARKRSCISDKLIIKFHWLIFLTLPRMDLVVAHIF